MNKITSGATFTFTSANTAFSSYLYDNRRQFKLTSIGSNDATPEVWIIDFGVSTTIDRIYIDNHNIKSGDLKYWDGAAYVDFSSAISWSANAEATNYYEFNSVSTAKIRLTMNTTMVVDAQKFVGELRAFVETGTVSVNPASNDFEIAEKSQINYVSDGGSIRVSFGEKYHADIMFSDANAADMTLFRTLKDSDDPFYFFPCGGITTYDQEGFRLRDMYLCNWINSFKPSLKSDLLGIGTSIRMELAEV